MLSTCILGFYRSENELWAWTMQTRCSHATTLEKCLLQAERPLEAMTQLQQTLTGEIALYGQDGSELIATHWNIAKCMRQLNQPANAAEHRIRCWKLECNSNGSTDPETLDTAVAVVQDLMAAEFYPRARTMIKHIVQTIAEAKDENPELEKMGMSINRNRRNHS